jgi:serine/threonine protein kinase
VHRDIKPDNILYSTLDHKIKLTDFTVSKKLKTIDTVIYDTGGTIAFQAPETMISGTGYLGAPADIWSLGVCIYVYCSGGHMPFWDPESEIQT